MYTTESDYLDHLPCGMNESHTVSKKMVQWKYKEAASMAKVPGGQRSWVSPKKYQQALFSFQYVAIPSIFLKHKASSHNIESHELNSVKTLEASSVRKAI